MVKALIDYLNAPGVVPLQRVVDNFDGDALRSWWNLTDVAGSGGSAAMLDEVDGGLRLSSPTVAFDSSQIDFNSINHYSQTSAEFIAVIRKSGDTGSRMVAGLAQTTWAASDSKVAVMYDTTGNIELRNGSTDVAGSVAQDTNWHSHKVTVSSTTTLMFTDGPLDAVNTSSLPSAALQPIFARQTNAASAKTGDIRYMEAYNT